MKAYISVKNYKIHNLQKEYIITSRTITKTQAHLNNLYYLNVINNTDYSQSLSELNTLVKQLNNEYNQFILDECDLNSEDSTDLMEIPDNSVVYFVFKNSMSEEEQFGKITHFIKISKHITPTIDIDKLLFDTVLNNPITKKQIELNQICKKIGYDRIETLMRYVVSENYSNTFDAHVKKMIDLYDSLIIPIKYTLKKSSKPSKHDIEAKKTKNNKDELLNSLIDITIKYSENNEHFYTLTITGFIQNDTINNVIKTCQIANKEIYAKKKEIEKAIKTTKYNYITADFKKKYLKYIIINDLLAYSVAEYIEKIVSDFNTFISLCNQSFMTLMKKFVKKDNTIYNMYNTIRLLLFGSNDSVNIAGLLFSLLKENSLGTCNIAEIIYNALNFDLKIKLKLVKTNLKEELDKVKNLSIDDIDYKKQLLCLKDVPLKVKALTNEKIDELSLNNNEYYKQLTYVKCILQYPWSCNEDDAFYSNLQKNKKERIKFLENAKNCMYKLSYGHKTIKSSLLEIIGKWISNPQCNGNVLSFVGPPGVGKTLLAKNIGSALNIPFVQITLGGQNDGELLYGHGYTYSGSQPGMIIRKMIEAGKSRCILYFDELDKAVSKHGNVNEIMSILIHLTDPNMNNNFQDRFFQGIDFPLHKVIMVFSYNDSSLIDPILLDRFKEIKVKSYTTNDKINIVKDFILPELLKNIGFPEKSISISDEDIEFILDNYTLESGVRGIKRKVEDIIMRLNIERLYNKGLFSKYDFFSNFTKTKKIIVSREKIIEILKKPINDVTQCLDQDHVGIISGLYATTNGNGGLVPIQIFKNYSSGKTFDIKLTGSQGDVMKESVMCAYTTAVHFIANNKSIFRIENVENHIAETFPNGFHVHAPDGATPKDGPSAGTAFTMAFISRITGLLIRNDVAITGEIDLNGSIQKIGGLPYKLIGAKKGNITQVIIPDGNKGDLEEIIEKHEKLIGDKFKVSYHKNIDEIINIVLKLTDDK